jgi:hypothetical protein
VSLCRGPDPSRFSDDLEHLDAAHRHRRAGRRALPGEIGSGLGVLLRVEHHDAASIGAVVGPKPDAAHETGLGLRRGDREPLEKLACLIGSGRVDVDPGDESMHGPAPSAPLVGADSQRPALNTNPALRVGTWTLVTRPRPDHAATTAEANMTAASNRALGVTAGLDAHIAGDLAARCEKLGYHSVWSNDDPTAPGMATLAQLRRRSSAPRARRRSSSPPSVSARRDRR